MKKALTLVLALTLLLSTAACGGKAEEETPGPEEIDLSNVRGGTNQNDAGVIADI